MTITESPVVPAPRGSHRLTTSKAMVEAIELEMERDPSVIYLGEDVGPGAWPLAVIHARSPEDAERAGARLKAAFGVGDAPAAPPLVELV